MMEIGAFARMTQRPIAVATVNRIGFLDDGREADLPRCPGWIGRQGMRRERDVDFKPAGKAPGDDFRRFNFRQYFVRLAVVLEGVRGPLSRRGKVELAVTGFAADADERFKTRVFPELIDPLGREFLGNAQPNDVAAQAIGEIDRSIGSGVDARVEAAHDRRRRGRVAEQDLGRDGNDGVDCHDEILDACNRGWESPRPFVLPG